MIYIRFKFSHQCAAAAPRSSRDDRMKIDNVYYLKYHALLNGIWAPIDTLYR